MSKPTGDNITSAEGLPEVANSLDHGQTQSTNSQEKKSNVTQDEPPQYAPPATPVPSRFAPRSHTNKVIEAAKIRAIDEVSRSS